MGDGRNGRDFGVGFDGKEIGVGVWAVRSCLAVVTVETTRSRFTAG